MKTKDETINEIKKEIATERAERNQEFLNEIENDFRAFIKHALENKQQQVVWPYGKIYENFLDKEAESLKKHLFENFLITLESQGWEFNLLDDNGHYFAPGSSIRVFLR